MVLLRLDPRSLCVEGPGAPLNQDAFALLGQKTDKGLFE